MEITEAEKKFARAALEVFKRYGVRKATMEEIAQEAGVSKPTLYATFKNKDAALGACIVLTKGTKLARIKEKWTSVESLNEKLRIFFDESVLVGFDLLHSSPDAAAFETALGEVSRNAISSTRQAEVDAIATVIDGSPGLSNVGFCADTFARYLVSSAMNAKRQAQDRRELEEYLNVLGASAVLVLEG